MLQVSSSELIIVIKPFNCDTCLCMSSYLSPHISLCDVNEDVYTKILLPSHSTLMYVYWKGNLLTSCDIQK